MLRTRLDCFSGAEARADAAASMEIGEAKPIRSSEVGSAATPHCLYEVFSTPYTDEEVARGVRAKQSICKGVVVEVAHCIRIPKQEYEDHLRYSVLEHYLYVGRNGCMLMALGVGSLFNHSKQPNLYFAIDHDHLVISCLSRPCCPRSSRFPAVIGYEEGCSKTRFRVQGQTTGMNKQ
ncbi:uncharacterized protein [Physcomitrium patens]|uniref:SET domain-containing protein n=1 Tax=Physcomitrium patens TaxID=3218 RepID=A0A7I4FNS8_PHYPA|nr:uncharacterized protein LOC112281013 isoform X2 [Physcomitrium patens]|eukprot:XP_024372886.1 uncharacterized protein LOC112281013 isoform X2 [Physcomitrella patens]